MAFGAARLIELGLHVKTYELLDDKWAKESLCRRLYQQINSRALQLLECYYRAQK